LGIWFFRRRKPPAALEIIQANNLQGVGGWLAVLGLVLAIGLARQLFFVVSYYLDPEIISIYAQFPLMGYGEALINASVIFFLGLTIYQMASHGRFFKLVFSIQAAILIVGYPLDTVWVGWFIGVPIDQLIVPEEAGQYIGGTFWELIWLWYVYKSQRVKNTFGPA
jgi:hypothetical protein